jgi:hypothetical protein
MSLLRTFFRFVLGAGLMGCSVPAIADVSVGPFLYTVTAARVMIPEALRDPASMSVRQIACREDTDCQQSAGLEPAVRCVASLCDPDPFEFVLSSDVLDLNDNANIQRYGDRVTRIEVRAGVFEASAQGLRIPVGPTELYWGPDSATSVDSQGVQLLGTVDVIDLSSADTTQGAITMDPAGSASLSEHLLRVSRRLRLFARPRIDVAPGGPLPSGAIAVQVQFALHVEGQLVR